MHALLTDKLAKWQTPDRVVFVDKIPHTGAGKFSKRDLRERYKGMFADEGSGTRADWLRVASFAFCEKTGNKRDGGEQAGERTEQLGRVLPRE